MFKILLAYDGSDSAKLALAKAGKIAEVDNAEIHIMTVGRIPQHAKPFYSKIIDEMSMFLKTQGMKASTRMAISFHTVDISPYADDSTRWRITAPMNKRAMSCNQPIPGC